MSTQNTSANAGLSDENLAERLTTSLSVSALASLMAVPDLPDTLRFSLGKATPTPVLDAILGARLGTTFGPFRWVLARWTLAARAAAATFADELTAALEFNREWTERALAELATLEHIPEPLLEIMLAGGPIPALVGRSDLPNEIRVRTFLALDAAACPEQSSETQLRPLPGRALLLAQTRGRSVAATTNFSELLDALQRDEVLDGELLAQLRSPAALEAALGAPEGPRPAWLDHLSLEPLLQTALDALATPSSEALNLVERLVALAPDASMARTWAARAHTVLDEAAARSALPGAEQGHWLLSWGLAAHELSEEIERLRRLDARFVLTGTGTELPPPSRAALSAWVAAELGENRQAWVLLLDMLEGFNGSLDALVAGARAALA